MKGGSNSNNYVFLNSTGEEINSKLKEHYWNFFK